MTGRLTSTFDQVGKWQGLVGPETERQIDDTPCSAQGMMVVGRVVDENMEFELRGK